MGKWPFDLHCIGLIKIKSKVESNFNKDRNFFLFVFSSKNFKKVFLFFVCLFVCKSTVK